MEKSEKTTLKTQLRDICRVASDEGLTVPEIDTLPDVDRLMHLLYPLHKLITIGRRRIIRSFLQEDVDSHGVRNRIAIIQDGLFATLPPTDEEGDDEDDLPEHLRSAVYMHRDSVLKEPALTIQALRKVHKRISSNINKTPALSIDTKLRLITAIDVVFDELMGELGS